MAAWSLPDLQKQQGLFGKVVAEGASLQAYVQWYNALSKKEANEWGTMLNGLTPESAKKTLGNFRFSENAHLAEKPCEILLQGLSAVP